MKLQFNGRNYYLYIPKEVVKALNLKQGQELELKINAKEFRVIKGK